jgi:hypothetical protein
MTDTPQQPKTRRVRTSFPDTAVSLSESIDSRKDFNPTSPPESSGSFRETKSTSHTIESPTSSSSLDDIEQQLELNLESLRLVWQGLLPKR